MTRFTGKNGLAPSALLRLVGAPLAAAIAVTALAGGAMISGLTEPLSWQLTDRLPHDARIDPRIFVVGTDDRTEGHTPAPADEFRLATMSAYERLLARLGEAGARVVVLNLGLKGELDEPFISYEDQRTLATGISRAGKVVVPCGDGFGFAYRMAFAPVAATGSTDQMHIHSQDGIVRSTRLVTVGCYGESPEPNNGRMATLALRAVLEYEGTNEIRASKHELRFGRHKVPLEGFDGNRRISEQLPRESSYETRIRWSRELIRRAEFRAGDSAHYANAMSILEPDFPLERLRDKLVFVGKLSSGGGQNTPVVDGVSDTLIEATVANMLLSDQYTSIVSTPLLLGFVFLIAFLAFLLTSSLRVWWSGGFNLALGVGIWLFAASLHSSGVLLDPSHPFIALITAAILGLAFRVLSEQRQRARVTTLLTQYVPTPIARQLVARGKGSALPTGMITFVFTDVVGSTSAWDRWPREMAIAMRRHDQLIESAVDASYGAVVRPRGEGDSRFVVFARPQDAIQGAMLIQDAFRREQWPTPEPIKLRVAIHTGAGDLREGDYYGSEVNRCARIRSIAQPGQVLASAVTATAVESVVGTKVALRDLGEQPIKDFPLPERIYEVSAMDDELALTGA